MSILKIVLKTAFGLMLGQTCLLELDVAVDANAAEYSPGDRINICSRNECLAS